jgi:anti-sigma B factor antagonist
MKTTVQEIDGRLVAVLEGELDTAASAEVEAALQPLFESEGKDLVLDCTGLEYIASSGLRILMNLVKKTRAQGDLVILKNVNDVIRDVLELTGFVSLFVFE